MDNKIYLVIILALAMIAITGCTSSLQGNDIMSMITNLELAGNCTPAINISLSTPGYCGTQQPVFYTYDNGFKQWNALCCDFTTAEMISNITNSVFAKFDNYYNITQVDAIIAGLNDTYYPLHSNPAGYITAANLSNGTFVSKTGDSMSGDLNMTNHSIWNVDTLSVHNITGRSPIYIASPIISGNSITAGTFYGDINGQNGTIYGVTITNGSIKNLLVADSAFFDTNVTFNGNLVPDINDTYTLGLPDKQWKSFHVVTLYVSNISSPDLDAIWQQLDTKVNYTYLDGNYYNKTYIDSILLGNITINLSNYYTKSEIDAMFANFTTNNTALNNTIIELETCDGNCTTIVEVEYI